MQHLLNAIKHRLGWRVMGCENFRRELLVLGFEHYVSECPADVSCQAHDQKVHRTLDHTEWLATQGPAPALCCDG